MFMVKFTDSLNELLWIVSTILYNLLLTLDGKESKISIPCCFTNNGIGCQQFQWLSNRSRHSVIKNLNDEKMHSSVKKLLFRGLVSISDQLYEVEPVKFEY